MAVKAANEAIAGLVKREEVMRETMEQRERNVAKLVAEVEEMREMVERSREEVVTRHALLLLLEGCVLGLLLVCCRGGRGRERELGSRRVSLELAPTQQQQQESRSQSYEPPSAAGLGGGNEEQQLSKRQRKRKRRRESASLLSRMPEESDEGVYRTFHGQASVQEVSERQRTRSSSWGEKEFQLLGEKGGKKVEKDRREERRRGEEERRREEEMRMEEMRREELLMQENELRREQANIAMQSYYSSYGSQGVAESYRRDESALNSSRFAVDHIEEPLSWRLQPHLHSPRLRDEQVVLSTTRRYHQQEQPLPYHPPPPPPPPPAPLYAQPRGYNRWGREEPRYRPDPVYGVPNGHDPHLENGHRSVRFSRPLPRVPPPPSLLVSNRFNLLDHSVHDTSGYLDTEGESEEGRTSTPRRHRGRGATSVRSKSSSPNRQANLLVRRQREMVARFQPEKAEWLPRQ